MFHLRHRRRRPFPSSYQPPHRLEGNFCETCKYLIIHSEMSERESALYTHFLRAGPWGELASAANNSNFWWWKDSLIMIRLFISLITRTLKTGCKRGDTVEQVARDHQQKKTWQNDDQHGSRREMKYSCRTISHNNREIIINFLRSRFVMLEWSSWQEPRKKGRENDFNNLIFLLLRMIWHDDANYDIPHLFLVCSDASRQIVGSLLSDVASGRGRVFEKKKMWAFHGIK